MASSPIIELTELSKSYRIYSRPVDRLRELLPFSEVSLASVITALQPLSLTIARGERVGILGENGSGKSTLLKLICGVLTPSTGTVVVRGRVTSLLELGTGFNPELTGRENILQNGMLLGFTPEEIEEKLPQIVEFSELKDFINQPLRTYSSGMVVRLAFSCAVFVSPEILIIDEALSVGDAYFQSKCYYKIRSLLDAGTTFLYVSHSYDTVKSLCTRGLLLDQGKLLLDDTAELVSNYYLKRVFEKQNESTWFRSDLKESTEKTVAESHKFKSSAEFERLVSPLRTGTAQVRIRNIELLSSGGEYIAELKHYESGVLRIHLEYLDQPPQDLSLGIALVDGVGTDVIQFTSFEEGIDLSGYAGGSKVVVEFSFVNILAPGTYTVKAGLASLFKDPIADGYHLIESAVDLTIGGLKFDVPRTGLAKSVWGKVSHPVDIRIIG